MSHEKGVGNRCFTMGFDHAMPRYGAIVKYFEPTDGASAFVSLPDVWNMATMQLTDRSDLSGMSITNVYVGEEWKNVRKSIRSCGFTNCVFDVNAFWGMAVVDGGYFNNCTFIFYSDVHYHPIFHECTFINCTFIRLVDTSGSKAAQKQMLVWEGNSLFSDGISNYESVFAPYYDPAVLPPPNTAFTAWKKALLVNEGSDFYEHIIVKLAVYSYHARYRHYQPHQTKIRVERAEVVEFYRIVETESGTFTLGESFDLNKFEHIRANYTPDLRYVKDTMVVPDTFDTNMTKPCSNGIHCFLNVQDAVDYDFS